MRCPYAYDDGAYVVGSLSAEERRSFVNHLPSCSSCRESVRGLSGLPSLLASVDTEETGVLGGAPLELPPPTLWPRLLNGAQADRVRRRRKSRLLAFAACLVVLLAVAVPLGMFAPFSPLQQTTTTTPEVSLQAMNAVGGGSTVKAEIGMVDKAWGTKVALHCSYADAGYGTVQSYTLFAVTRSGLAEQIGSWSVGPGKEITTDAATKYHRGQLAALEIRRADGETILRRQI